MSIHINGKPLATAGEMFPYEGSIESALLELCERGGYAEGSDVYVRYPARMPSSWLAGGQVTDSTINRARHNGWRDIEIDGRHFLTPPDAVLGEVLSPIEYSFLLSAGLAKKEPASHAISSDAFLASPAEAIELRLFEMCANSSIIEGGQGRELQHPEAFLVYASNGEVSAESVRAAINDGWVLINADGTHFMVPPDAIAHTSSTDPVSLNWGELDRFESVGLISIRTAGRRGAPSTEAESNASDVGSDPRSVYSGEVDLDLLQLRQWERWSDPSAVVDFSSYSWLERYPELKDWLASRIEYVEPLDMTRLGSIVSSGEGSKTIEKIDGLAQTHLQGIIGEIAARAGIVAEYQKIATEHPNAILLVAPQIATGDAKEASDAVVGEFIAGPDGEARFKTYAAWEITTGSDTQAEAQMERTAQRRVPASGIRIRGDNDVRRNLEPLDLFEDAELTVVTVELSAQTIEVLELTQQRIGANLSDVEFGDVPKESMPKKYHTRDMLIEALQAFERENGRPPTEKDANTDPDLAYPNTYAKYFGSWNAALEVAGFELNVKFRSRETLITELKALGESLGRTPTVADLKKHPEMASDMTYSKHFGSWNAALEAAGFEPNVQLRFRSGETLIAEFRMLGESLGRPPTRADLEKHPEMASRATYKRHFGSWNAALEAAGFEPNHRVAKGSVASSQQVAISADAVDMVEFWEQGLRSVKILLRLATGLDMDGWSWNVLLTEQYSVVETIRAEAESMSEKSDGVASGGAATVERSLRKAIEFRDEFERLLVDQKMERLMDITAGVNTPSGKLDGIVSVSDLVGGGYVDPYDPKTGDRVKFGDIPLKGLKDKKDGEVFDISRSPVYENIKRAERVMEKVRAAERRAKK